MTHGSLFSGIGGFDLAAQWMGWENAFHCEINPFGRQVLNYYWPNAVSYEDITKTDFTIWRGRIDVLTGGFPCQPFSLAGKRKGTEDERHLWPEMLRAIREIKPRWIVGENVFGLVNWDGGLVFEQVQADLENEGYEVQPYILPAASVNAPHRRDRVWFVAHAIDSHDRGASGRHESESGAERIQERDDVREPGESSGVWVAKNSDSNGRRGEFRKEEPKVRRLGYACSGNNERIQADHGEAGATAHAKSNGDRGGLFGMEEKNGKIRQPQEHRKNYCKSWHNGKERDAADPRSPRQQECNPPTIADGPGHGSGICFEKPRCWDEFPTQPPVCSRDDGIPAGLVGITVSKHRNESIKAYGNAIVPQVVYQIFKAIQEYEISKK